MDKSDNENIAHTVKLYLFEAKDHPINDECRKYKSKRAIKPTYQY
ncbi:hypothetical protein PNIG_a0820 [Pseudoalteromonas nigrifaciens]|uniref:Uncharacterized protein n=1 Tax=Pseudoalteromonas nigrifaciens TaxID=28109 RepID=A0AAC9UGN6_9GAMM|nr:hypothetical protein [Pseudoalteromonas nigrifaciens]ASM53079.1 hypothetical protein PNIG_a0820 [Pseudoalteromonas nigrifaciens]SUC53054.1 Uncharacterised protein [Pseudoalteromonas nigrifaciens]